MEDVKQKLGKIVDRVNLCLKELGKKPLTVEYRGAAKENEWRDIYIMILSRTVTFENRNDFGRCKKRFRHGLERDGHRVSPLMRRRYGGGRCYGGERVFSMNRPHRYREYMLAFRGNVKGLTSADKRKKTYGVRNMFDFSRPVKLEMTLMGVASMATGYVSEEVIFEKAFLFGMDYEVDRSVAIGKYFDWLAEQRIGRVIWDDIGGMDKAKETVEKMTIMIDEHPEIFENQDRDHILLVGPPGVGKTLIIKGILWRLYGKANILPYTEVARILGVFGEDAPTDTTTYIINFINTLHKYTNRWTYLFIDEIDSIGQENTQAKALLREMDNYGARKFSILATTNRPDVMDFALFRPGRFYPIVFVGLPDRDDRRAIWDLTNDKYQLGMGSRERYIKRTDNFSGADIMHVGKMAWRESRISILNGDKFDVDEFLLDTIAKMKEETVKKNNAWCDRVKGFLSQSEATVMYI